MSKRRMLLLRIAGSVVGVLVVGIAVGATIFFGLHWANPTHDHAQGEVFMVAFSGLGGLVLGTAAAAVGATVTQKLLRQRSSFWRALLGAVVGLVVGAVCWQLLILAVASTEGALAWVGILAAIIVLLAPIAAGAVIGSGWKAKPRDAASPSA